MRNNFFQETFCTKNDKNAVPNISSASLAVRGGHALLRSRFFLGEVLGDSFCGDVLGSCARVLFLRLVSDCLPFCSDSASFLDRGFFFFRPSVFVPCFS